MEQQDRKKVLILKNHCNVWNTEGRIKIRNMKDLLNQWKWKQLMEADQHACLNEVFWDILKHLFENHSQNIDKNSPNANWYSLDTKQFAMTLHYYSPRAYDFVNKVI